MACCERGPERDRPTLYWQHRNAKRVPIRFFPEPGVACDTEVRHSVAVLLEILCEQWLADTAKIDALRGFVLTGELARRYAERCGNHRPITDQAIYQYVKDLHRDLREAAALLGLDVDTRLIENKSRVGYRIAGCGLVIEDTFD